MRIYQFFTKILFQCAPMLYSKAKSSCFLNTIFQYFILTPSVMMGKTVSPLVIRAVSKSFSYLIELLVRMNFRQDVGLMEKLNHLVVKWSPLLRSSDNNVNLVVAAYIRLFRKIDTVAIDYVVTQFCNAFLAPNGRMPGPHAQWSAQVFKAVFHELQGDVTKANTIINSAISTLLDHLITVDESNLSRKILMELLFDIVGRRNSPEEFQHTVLNALRSNTKRKLIHHEKLFFNFMRQLARSCPVFTQTYLPHLKDSILDVENMLGVSKDSGLRGALNTLEEIVRNSRK